MMVQRPVPDDFHTPRIRPPRYQARHVPTPHEDATRPEPEDINREKVMKAALKAAFRGTYEGPLTTREETATGRALADRFVDRLDTWFWFAYGCLSDQIRGLLWLQYGSDDLTLDEAAQRMNLARRTAYRYRHDALEYLCRVYWDEPDYHLPYRTEARDDARAMIHDELSAIEWD